MRRILNRFFFPEAPPTLADDLAGFALFVSPIAALVALVNLLA